MNLSRSILLLSSLILFTAPALADNNYDNSSTSHWSKIDNVEKAGDIGAGLQVGSYSGINAEFWLTNFTAIGASFAFQNGNNTLSVDHRWFARHAFSGRAAAFAPYIGAGAAGIFGTNSDNYDRGTQSNVLAAQAPVGMEFLPQQYPVSAFAELIPGLEVAPVATGVLTADLGARFYF